MPRSPRSPRRWRRAGFELVDVERDRPPTRCRRWRPPNTSSAIRTWRATTRFYKAAPKLKLYQLLSAGYDDVDIEAARRAKVPVCNNGGANAISVSEHAIMLMLDGVAPGDLAARQRLGRPLARQRRRRRGCTRSTTRRSASSASAPSARRWRGSPAPSACGCSITTSRGCPSTRRTRSACASGCSASCCAPPTSSPCTCRSTIRPAT